MRNTIIACLLLLFPCLVMAQTPLYDFQHLMNALQSGKEVSTVIYYGKCDLYSKGVKEEKSPNAIGGLKLNTYEYFDSSMFRGKVPSFVTTSETVLINHPRYGYVFNYVKIKIKMDGSVEITARYLREKKLSSKYKVLMDETFKGKMNDGMNDGAIFLYAE